MSEPTQFALTAKEAVCSALYGMEFSRFLGERPDVVTGWDVAWFRLSRDPSVELSARADPKQVMVAVFNESESVVVVHISWLNLTGDEPIKGDQYLRFVADPDQQQQTVFASERAVLRVLEVFGDVVQETGVAGPLEDLAPETAFEETETDMAKTDEEVGRQ